MKSFLIELTLDIDEDADPEMDTMDVACIFADFDPGCGVLTVENIQEVGD